MNILILGVGNFLLSDEGIGIHVVNTLLKDYNIPPDVSVIDGGTAGMELLNFIRETKHLILIDAVKTGQPPATVVTLSESEIPALFKNKMSIHQLGLSDVLAAANLTGVAPETMTLIGIVPVSLELGTELSSEVQQQLPQLLTLVQHAVEKLGHHLALKS